MRAARDAAHCTVFDAVTVNAVRDLRSTMVNTYCTRTVTAESSSPGGTSALRMQQAQAGSCWPVPTLTSRPCKGQFNWMSPRTGKPGGYRHFMQDEPRTT